MTRKEIERPLGGCSNLSKRWRWIGFRVGEMEDTHTLFGDSNDRTCYDELDDKRWGNEGKRGIGIASWYLPEQSEC